MRDPHAAAPPSFPMRDPGLTAPGRLRARLACAALLAVACSGGPVSPAGVGQGFVLEASGGVYDDGSGALGLAVLSTLRDASGAGPRVAWTATLRDPAGAVPASVTYADAAVGSYDAWWWPRVPPRDGTYALSVSDGTGALEVGFEVASVDALPRPVPVLSAEASALSWNAIPGAGSYACRVSTEGALRLSTVGTAPTCDLSSLPPGAYAASVLAISADLVALAGATTQAPALPARFDVSEARLAFIRPLPGAPALRLAVAGGALWYGPASPGLALWTSITDADGSATTAGWTLSVTGPGLPPDAPLTFAYPAGVRADLAWSYDATAAPGDYSVTAVSGDASMEATVRVGASAVLDLPVPVSAAGAADGSAAVDWPAVAGARSYFVGVWREPAVAGGSAAFVEGRWVSAPPADFAPRSFASGAYRVYVDATDADMVAAAAPPARVSVSESSFLPGSFAVP